MKTHTGVLFIYTVFSPVVCGHLHKFDKSP